MCMRVFVYARVCACLCVYVCAQVYVSSVAPQKNGHDFGRDQCAFWCWLNMPVCICILVTEHTQIHAHTHMALVTLECHCARPEAAASKAASPCCICNWTTSVVV